MELLITLACIALVIYLLPYILAFSLIIVAFIGTLIAGIITIVKGKGR